jgi:hypothetical protein
VKGQGVREVLLDAVPDMKEDTTLDVAEAVVEELFIERRVNEVFRQMLGVFVSDELIAEAEDGVR